MASNPQRQEGGLGRPWEGAACGSRASDSGRCDSEGTVTVQPYRPGSGHREPCRGLPCTGVWVRTPRFAWDPSPDSPWRGQSVFSRPGTRKKPSERHAHFPAIVSCLENTHTNKCFQTSESKAHKSWPWGHVGELIITHPQICGEWECICRFCQKGASIAKQGCRPRHARKVVLGAQGEGQWSVTDHRTRSGSFRGKGCKQEACRRWVW